MTDTLGFVPLPSNSGNDSNTEAPVLRIDCFNPRTIIDFGDVKAGKTAIKSFTIENPHDEEVEISTVKFPTTRTILLHGYTAEESKTRSYRVPPASCIDVNVAWTPVVNGSGGMRQTIELQWERKRFIVMMVGFIVEVKQKKRAVRRIVRRVVEKPLDMSLGKDENNANQRFKGVVNHTAVNDKSNVPDKTTVPDKKMTKILGENQSSNVKNLRQETSKRKQLKEMKPLLLNLKPNIEPDEENTPNIMPITPLKPKQESPFSNLETPSETPPTTALEEEETPTILPTRTLTTPLKLEAVTTPFSTLETPGDPLPATAPTPVQSLVKQECMSSGSGGSGEGSAGTPRKRRTWGAPDINPLFNTPNVTTRAALKKIGEDSVYQRTFMECHTILHADSVLERVSLLERVSPPRDRDCDNPLSPGPLPFTPPNVTVMEPKVAPHPLPVPSFNVSPDDTARMSGPLTATPLHPSMVLNMDKREDNLPNFNTSIIPHLSPKGRLSESTPVTKSEVFVIPAIETTSSTVNLSHENTSTPMIKPGERKPADAARKAAATKPIIKSHAKSKKAEVQFRAPLIKSSTTTTTGRPKTAPGLSRREALKKNMTQDMVRPIRHPTKRRSVSASRVESTPKSSFDMNVKPPKRKDLVTPTMPTMPPPKSPSKRPRPIQRVVSTDESFREKRHRSCDVAKTPGHPGGRTSRRSVVPPSTGTRVKMQTTRLSTALPRHPLALTSASNFYFDEKWKAKQERAFTVWMNFYLCPPQGSIPPDYQTTRDIMKNAARKARKSVAPPDNAKILAKLQAERKLLQAERRACALFQSAEMVLLKLEKEINDGGLTIRDDRKLDADLGLKDRLIDLLLCYNPVWLRLALEVLYEEILPLSEHRDLPGLVAFLNTRFVNNPVIAQRFAHPTVPGSYGAGYEQELRKFTLKRFLMLVLLLDVAKTARVIEHDPCLFCLKSPHKTSRSILISFSNAFLSGEGDITKHLGYIGYTVKHEQKHIEEVDYTVKRIETELRDGTRLTRLVEIITETSLTDKLRAPAVSRLQKLHNVGLMLTQLQEEGVKLDNVPGGPIISKSVVDGNQNLTLALIWRIIFQYSIKRILAVDQLKAEIRILKEILSRRKQLNPSNTDEDDDFVLGLPGRRLSIDERGFFNSVVLTTLMDWCKIVCSYYDVPVDNFTVSFSDGRVLCLLVHHYHPELIPFGRIKLQTSLSHRLMELNASRDFLSNSLLDPELHKENEKENFRALADAMKGLNEVPSMIFAQDMLGTIPDEKVVITFVAYLCTALVDISQDFRAAQRIQRAWRRHKFLEQHDAMREKRRTVIKVQALVRSLLARRKLEELKLNREAIVAARKDYAARRIQLNWRTYTTCKDPRREFLKKREAATTIQRFYKAILEERWRDRICAAKLIQKTWRGHRDRSRYLTLQRSAVKIQSVYKMHRCRANFLRTKSAVEIISQIWRSYEIMKQDRAEFQQKRSAAVCIQKYLRGYGARQTAQKIRSAIKIQSLFRGYKARLTAQGLKNQRQLIEHQIRSSILIQSLIRGFIVRRDVQRMQVAASAIQQYFRSHLLTKHHRENFLHLRKHIILLQSRVRGYIVRKELSKQRYAVIKLQAAARSYLARSLLQQQHQSAALIQQAFRGYLLMKSERLQFKAKREASIRIQSYWKMVMVVRAVTEQNKAATLVQSGWRMYSARSVYCNQRAAALQIQGAWKRYQVREKIRDEKLRVLRTVLMMQSYFRGTVLRSVMTEQQRCAVRIQSVFRGYTIRRDICHQHESAAVIQNCYRGYQDMKAVRSRYVAMRFSAIVIQSHIRSYLVRRYICRSAAAATKIQARYRGYCVRRSYLEQRTAAVYIQSQVRAWIEGWKQRGTYLQLRNTAITLQSLYRGTQTRRQIHKQQISAAKIQAAWRMYVTRSQYLDQKQAAVKLQAAWRMYLQTRSYNELKLRTIQIQAWYRMHRQVELYKLQRRSAVLIQSSWRGYSARREYLTVRSAVLRLQAAMRGYKSRQIASCLKTLREDYKQLRERVMDQAVSLSQVREIKKTLSEYASRGQVYRSTILKEK